MSFALRLAPLRKFLSVLLSLSFAGSLLWVLFFTPLGIWWKIILVITLIGVCSIALYLRSMWIQANASSGEDIVVPVQIPAMPAREPSVGKPRDDSPINTEPSPSQDSELKYCERLKPVVVTCLIVLVALLSFASLMLSLQIEPNATIESVVFWINIALWLYVAVRVYLWSKTYLIVTGTRAILATITPFGVMKPNVLLKDASSQDVRQNIFDKWLKTGTLFLDTPSKKDTLWHHLRWIQHPDRLEIALGLPTTKEINDAIHKDRNLRKAVKEKKRRQ